MKGTLKQLEQLMTSGEACASCFSRLQPQFNGEYIDFPHLVGYFSFRHFSPTYLLKLVICVNR